MSVLIVKNIHREGPGLLESILKESQISYVITDLGLGSEFPDPKHYKAIVVLGGPDSANDVNPKMSAELQRIREATDDEIPYLGICLGMQTLVKANDGEVYPNMLKEIGWRGADKNYFTVEFTTAGKSDPLLKGLKSPMKIFQLHGETVKLTDRMKLLATGKYCENQIVKVGKNAYGIQGHFELTEQMFDLWRRVDPDLTALNQDALIKDYKTVKAEYESNGRQILNNFLAIAKLI